MCPECEERRQKVRQAWLEHNLQETGKQLAIGAVELVKKKIKLKTKEVKDER